MKEKKCGRNERVERRPKKEEGAATEEEKKDKRERDQS